MKCVLITGSEGNIGSFITEQVHLQHPDWTIVRVTRNPKHAGDHAEIGDLLDPAFTSHLFQKYQIDSVIHAAAAPYEANAYKTDPYGIFRNDVGCLLNVLDGAAAGRVKKFIYLSSATVYESATEVPFKEEMTGVIPPPQSPYGLAKSTGEQAVELAARQTSMSTTIWRLFNVVSPREPHDIAGHVYVDFYRKLFVEQAPSLDIFGDGRQVRCFTWVGDVADGIVRFMDDTRTDDQTFNLGSNEPATLIELKDTMLRVGKRLGLLPADYQPEIRLGMAFFGVDSPARIPSLDKVTKILGWTPTTGLEACLEHFIQGKQSL